MSTVQTLDIRGEKFVLMPQAEYRRLTKRTAPTVPALPARSADGTYPAAAAMRAMMARKIIAARHAAGLSQAALARKAGIRVETLNRLEKGKHTPDLATMAKINKALDGAGTVTRRSLMNNLATLLDRLRPFGIRGPADYAEQLIAEALGGTREASGVNKGYDVSTPKYGRIEVKCRQLPADGRLEERVALGDSKKEGFDHLAIVIFFPDLTVKGAILVPYAVVWTVVTTQRYNRISFAQAFALPGSIDITQAVFEAAEK